MLIADRIGVQETRLDFIPMVQHAPPVKASWTLLALLTCWRAAAATPAAGPRSATAAAESNSADAPPADIQAAYVAQYMATVARLAAAQSTVDQKKPDLKGVKAQAVRGLGGYGWEPGEHVSLSTRGTRAHVTC